MPVPNPGPSRQEHGEPAAVGFTVKSGWAAVVLLAGPAVAPRVLDACRIELSDPSVPDARQPYHHGFGTARSAGPALTRLVGSVRRFGRNAVTALLRRYSMDGCPPARAGIAVGSRIDPDRITNEHIRIHALEGRLFRSVIEDALGRAGLSSRTATGRDLLARASTVLERTESEVQLALSALDRPQPRPWRAEQKLAALAAWLALADPRRD